MLCRAARAPLELRVSKAPAIAAGQSRGCGGSRPAHLIGRLNHPRSGLCPPASRPEERQEGAASHRRGTLASGAIDGSQLGRRAGGWAAPPPPALACVLCKPGLIFSLDVTLCRVWEAGRAQVTALQPAMGAAASAPEAPGDAASRQDAPGLHLNPQHMQHTQHTQHTKQQQPCAPYSLALAEDSELVALDAAGRRLASFAVDGPAAAADPAFLALVDQEVRALLAAAQTPAGQRPGSSGSSGAGEAGATDDVEGLIVLLLGGGSGGAAPPAPPPPAHPTSSAAADYELAAALQRQEAAAAAAAAAPSPADVRLAAELQRQEDAAAGADAQLARRWQEEEDARVAAALAAEEEAEAAEAEARAARSAAVAAAESSRAVWSALSLQDAQAPSSQPAALAAASSSAGGGGGGRAAPEAFPSLEAAASTSGRTGGTAADAFRQQLLRQHRSAKQTQVERGSGVRLLNRSAMGGSAMGGPLSPPGSTPQQPACGLPPRQLEDGGQLLEDELEDWGQSLLLLKVRGGVSGGV